MLGDWSDDAEHPAEMWWMAEKNCAAFSLALAFNRRGP